MKFVVGHLNPDTDTVVSTIAFSVYLKRNGIKAQPVVLGKLNRETEFVFRLLKAKSPQLLKRVSSKNEFYLVDHGSPKQSIPKLKREQILGVIDHHQMMGIDTLIPIFYRCEVVGSTSTLIFKMFQEKGWKLDKKIASLLSAGIISDTLNLNSKTTTIEDRKALKNLTQQTRINLKKFSQEMFEAKSDITGIKLKDILTKDYKEYNHKNKKIGIGVFESVSVGPFKEKKDEIFTLLKKIKEENNVDLLFFGLVDIIKKETLFYIIGEKESVVAQKAFKKSSKIGEIMLLEGITSRKKEMVPFIFKSI